MSNPRQTFPYERGTSIFVRAATLNLLAQVKAPGETWTYLIERIVRGWAREHGITLVDNPTLENGLRIRQEGVTLPLFDKGGTKHERQG